MIPLRDDEPTRTFPFVTVAIIVLNALVFAGWQLQVGLQQSVALAALVPVEVTTGAPGAITNVFTSMFMHGGWMHLIGNMWFLWIFGNNIEDACGSIRFTAFYLACGIAAVAAHIFAAPDSAAPLVGASGAVSGVLGAYLLKHPRATVLTLVPLGFFTRLMHVPAPLFLLIWIGLQILQQMATPSRLGGGGVAYLAHIGGFVAGMAFIFIFQRRDEAIRPRTPRRGVF